MAELDNAIARLRMFLAEVSGKEKQLEALARQFSQQLSRAPQRAIYAHMPLESYLNVMGEIEERLAKVQQEQKHLRSIKQRAQAELDALTVTRQIEEAKKTLADLQGKLKAGDEPRLGIQAAIHELERAIEELSQRAGRAITEAASQRVFGERGG